MEFASPILLANVMMLGLRHGLDWDHLAAIFDIVGTVRQGDARNAASSQKRAVYFSFLYALGHAFVCVVLGLGALTFKAILPDWIDPIMERVVGLTLIFLGIAILATLVNRSKHDHFQMRSRWMLVLEAAGKMWRKLSACLGKASTEVAVARSYGPYTAFGIGMIHGIGAETASQVLMIVAVSQVAAITAQVSVLLVFVFGLLVSNTVVSLCAAAGYLTSRQIIHVVIGSITGIFSILLGSLFLVGISI